MKLRMCMGMFVALAACKADEAKTPEAQPPQPEQAKVEVKPATEADEPAKAPQAAAAPAAFQKMAFDAAEVATLTSGKIEKGLRWKDTSGDNVLFLDRIEKKGQVTGTDVLTTIMGAHHFRLTDGKWTSVRDYKEVVDQCEFDTIAEVRIDANDWSLTDINNDGVAEATWAWYSGCASDVSPTTKKVMLTIGGEKYPLRGDTQVDPGNGELMGGDFKPDPAFSKIDAAFLEHAKTIWKKSGN